VVVFVAAYAITRLLLEGCQAWRAGRRSWRSVAADNHLELALLGLSIVWALLFVTAMYPGTTFSYVVTRQKSLSHVLLRYLHNDWLVPILLGVVIVRFKRFLFSRGEIDPLWDSLAVGALAYSFSILSLRMFALHYMAPANFIALIYLAYMSRAWLLKPTQMRVAIVAIALGGLLLHDVAYSTFRVTERKGTIAAKSQLAEFLKSYVSTNKGDAVELYFPYASRYSLMELTAYLRQKGFHLAGQSLGGPEVGPALVVTCGEVSSLNRSYSDYRCVHADRAQAGALIVLLPDDPVPRDGVEDIRKHAVSLLSVGPSQTCTKLWPWFRLTWLIYPPLWLRIFPPHWLRLDVFQESLG